MVSKDPLLRILRHPGTGLKVSLLLLRILFKNRTRHPDITPWIKKYNSGSYVLFPDRTKEKKKLTGMERLAIIPSSQLHGSSGFSP